ncbi:MAG: 1-acyl-sn-glycerol-3-phosphate acyltransferase [Lachnospiraceae bacterium]|jgi:1-acyl-sn-glycerol-3-phosphate acyltransferase|nr:1-acyl-sn-glycerol-3-phosphate acyltransferase [Lachnospiraceae bacterium]
MLRTIFAFAFAALYLIFGIVCILINGLVGLFSRRSKDRLVSLYAKVGLNVVALICGAKDEVIGLENVQKDRAALYVVNHRSFFDAILMYKYMPCPTGFMVKIEIKKVPLLNYWVRALYCLFVDRKDTRQGLEAVMKGIDYVKNGVSIIVFPEGTRNHDEGTLMPFHAGSFKIAERPGAPIIPVTIVNTGAIWEDHFPTVRPQHVIIEFGKPIETAGMRPEERRKLVGSVRDVMLETYARNSAKLEAQGYYKRPEVRPETQTGTATETGENAGTETKQV